MLRYFFIALGLFLVGLLAGLPPVAAADSPFEAAFRTSLLRSFNDASGKLLSLAERIPESTRSFSVR